MLCPIPVGLLASAVPPAFTGYNAYYLIGVTNNPWTPALPQGVTGDPAIWSISPALPTGLTINPLTGAISGTPTATVNTSFTVYATNAGGVASQNVTVTVTADTYAEWTTPGVHLWKIPNGVNNAYIRLLIASGGGGGTRAGTFGDGDPCSGAGGGSGRQVTNLDYSPGGNFAGQIPPGTELTITIGAGGAAGASPGDPGMDGEPTLIDFEGGIVSGFNIAGGGGATPALGPGFPIPTGGLAGGGNHGMVGYDGYGTGDVIDPGGIFLGGSGAYGLTTHAGTPFTYGSFPFGNYGPSNYIYWDDAYFTTWTISSNASTLGAGGGGETIARSAYGLVSDVNFNKANDGADGMVYLDWGQADIFWVPF